AGSARHAVLVFCERLARQNDRLVVAGCLGRIERSLGPRCAAPKASRRGAGLAIVAAVTHVLRAGQGPVVASTSGTTPAKTPAISSPALAGSAAAIASALARPAVSAALASAFARPIESAALASAFARPIESAALASSTALKRSLPRAAPVSRVARRGVAEVVLAKTGRGRAGRRRWRGFFRGRHGLFSAGHFRRLRARLLGRGGKNVPALFLHLGDLVLDS